MMASGSAKKIMTFQNIVTLYTKHWPPWRNAALLSSSVTIYKDKL